ncbi:hypothetical protein [Halomonas salipaludis]|uniref:Uncharacterized protein n=1 Tax=Halomonas salipaludis TaxID=2032625 RepID=A0A2A2EWH2_9GAMM|nr:hypothetical protein [Halomonas salipaludis]PAU76755.1 hypothetical protein CK498_12295 [Halomonas salipaludis]
MTDTSPTDPKRASRLDPRDHLLARQALTEAVTELAKRGISGEALQRHAVEIATALREGLAVLSAAAENGSDRQSPDALH